MKWQKGGNKLQADASVCAAGAEQVHAWQCFMLWGSIRGAEKSSTKPAETGGMDPVLRLVPCSGDPKQPQTTAASQASHQARISWQLKAERQLPTQIAIQKSITWTKPNQFPGFQLEEMAIHMTNLGTGVCAAELRAPQHLYGGSLLPQTPTAFKLLLIPKILSAW